MQRHDVDVAIIGGGCAGLSLAKRLANTRLQVTVLEPRRHYEEDRTWSFWTDAPEHHAGCLRRQWKRWTVAYGDQCVLRSSTQLRYVTLSSQAVYRQALETCDAASNVTLCLGTRVTGDPSISAGRDSVIVESDAGSLRARWVVDTRPSGRSAGYGQYFLGREIRLSRAAFDPSNVGLMHYCPPRTDRIDFLYILPFAADHALVEATSFAPVSPGRPALNALLDRACARASGGGTIETLREESGFIPMRTVESSLNAGGGPIVQAGLAGGAARPSTGYAFQRIQYSMVRCADALLRGEGPRIGYAEGPVSRWMDGLFLSVLQRWPENGPAMLVRLFRNAPADRLERFLSGSNAARDRLAVVGALPPLPFLRQLIAV